ncbi:MAG: tyrosine-type recombinase/integrase [Oscillospiraceae bacterium]|jgi:site-specific recombinase XerD|nr:tyrosine-type recombinase/integrase [Oscillospiraceae bacterium]
MTYHDAPVTLREFLTYHESIKGHSAKTVDQYFLDLRMFFRFIKIQKNLVVEDTPFDEISIADVDLALIKSVTMTDVYDFLTFLSRERPTQQNSDATDYGVSAKTRARKVASLRSFFKYLTLKTKQLAENPILDLDPPKALPSLPHFLSLEEAQNLLKSVKGRNYERNYCILTLFLNCGLRISEVSAVNMNDITADALRLHGKGGKERTVYLNDACVDAINAYIPVRVQLTPPSRDARAMFLSEKTATGENGRITAAAVHKLVKKHLLDAGLSPTDYSAHKLRHTAATLMLRSGVDVRTLQELLGHEHLNTTQIYTHVEQEGLRDAARMNPLAEFKAEPEKEPEIE